MGFFDFGSVRNEDCDKDKLPCGCDYYSCCDKCCRYCKDRPINRTSDDELPGICKRCYNGSMRTP